jgi:hypothetical protein
MKKLLSIAIVALALGSCKKEAEVKPAQPVAPNCNCKTITRVGDSYVVSINPTVWKQNIYYNNDCTNVSTYETVNLGNYKVGDKKCN